MNQVAVVYDVDIIDWNRPHMGRLRSVQDKWWEHVLHVRAPGDNAVEIGSINLGWKPA